MFSTRTPLRTLLASAYTLALFAVTCSLLVAGDLSAQTVTRGPYLQLGTPSSVIVRWRTNVATTARVQYGNDAGNLNSIVDSPVNSTEHEVTLTGLSPDTRYYYSVGTSTVTTDSNTSTIQVAERLDAVLTLASATVQVSPGATAEELVFTLTNTGNGSERFNLTALSAGVVGDDFDPTLASPAIYFDSDNSGDFSGGDAAYNPGVNDPVLAADASVRLLVINNIPATVVNGNRGRSQLTAAAASGTGPYSRRGCYAGHNAEPNHYDQGSAL